MGAGIVRQPRCIMLGLGWQLTPGLVLLLDADDLLLREPAPAHYVLLRGGAPERTPIIR